MVAMSWRESMSVNIPRNRAVTSMTAGISRAPARGLLHNVHREGAKRGDGRDDAPTLGVRTMPQHQQQAHRSVPSPRVHEGVTLPRARTSPMVIGSRGAHAHSLPTSRVHVFSRRYQRREQRPPRRCGHQNDPTSEIALAHQPHIAANTCETVRDSAWPSSFPTPISWPCSANRS